MHPKKQMAVKKTIENVPEWIEYIILFGSATNPTCKDSSDIDMVLIGNNIEEEKYTFKLKEESYEILQYSSIKDYLESVNVNPYGASMESYKKGVIIYEREKNVVR